MTNIKNCVRCGRLYNSNIEGDFCYDCLVEEEKQYDDVSKYLKLKKPYGGTYQELIKETGVDEIFLNKWINQKRLICKLMTNMRKPCLKCGELTRNDKICSKCADIMKDELKAIEIKKQIKSEELSTYFHRKND